MFDEKPLKGKVVVDEPMAAVEINPEMSVYELVKKHAAESKPEHVTVAEALEHMSLAGWQRAAILARFKGHGLHVDARLPADVMQKAVHEALHGAL